MRSAGREALPWRTRFVGEIAGGAEVMLMGALLWPGQAPANTNPTVLLTSGKVGMLGNFVGD